MFWLITYFLKELKKTLQNLDAISVLTHCDLVTAYGAMVLGQNCSGNGWVID